VREREFQVNIRGGLGSPCVTSYVSYVNRMGVQHQTLILSKPLSHVYVLAIVRNMSLFNLKRIGGDQQ
jgi:hypothetical protein